MLQNITNNYCDSIFLRDSVVIPSKNISNTLQSFLLLLELLTVKFAKKQICTKIQSFKKHQTFYDFVIIGGGTAGAVLANRLSENGHKKVLLLEAGDNEPIELQIPALNNQFKNYSSLTWDNSVSISTNDGPYYKTVTYKSAKVLGGESSMSDMTYFRGNPSEYDNWKFPDWRYSEIEEYFLKSENNLGLGYLAQKKHGSKKPLTVSHLDYESNLVRAFDKSIDLIFSKNDFHGNENIGFTKLQSIHRNNSRLSTAKAYLSPIQDRENLHIMLNATALKIQFIKNTTKAKGVKYIQNDKYYFVHAKDEIIIAAGAINTAKILMDSGIGPKSILSSAKVPIRKHIEGVGRNLKFRIGVKLEFTTNDLIESPLTDDSISNYNRNQYGPLSSTGLSQIFGLLKKKSPNMSYTQVQFEENIGIGRTTEFKAIISVDNTDNFGSILIRDNNLLSKPEIYVKLQSQDIRKPILEGIKKVLKIVTGNSLEKNYKVQLKKNSVYNRCNGNNRPDSDEAWDCFIAQSMVLIGSPIGTCKMGKDDDPLAVVDNQLKIRGVDKIRIVDKAIMPSYISGNLIAPTIMVAERGAKLIQQ